MRNLSAAVRDILSTDNYSAYLLLTLTLKGVVYNYTSLPYNVTLNRKDKKGNMMPCTYRFDHGILSLEPPKLGNSLTKDSYTVKMADPTFQFKEDCVNAPVASSIRIDAGFMNTSQDIVYSHSGIPIAPGQPILDHYDLVNNYIGTIDSLQYVMSEKNGIVLELKASSPMGALDATNVYYLTPSFLQERTQGVYDTAFDYVVTPGNSVAIKWGKIA